CLCKHTRWEVELCPPTRPIDLNRRDKLHLTLDPDRRQRVDNLIRRHGPLVLHAHVAADHGFVWLAPCHAKQRQYPGDPNANSPHRQRERGSDHAHAHRYRDHRGHDGASLDPLIVPGGQHQVTLSVTATVFDHTVAETDLKLSTCGLPDQRPSFRVRYPSCPTDQQARGPPWGTGDQPQQVNGKPGRMKRRYVRVVCGDPPRGLRKLVGRAQIGGDDVRRVVEIRPPLVEPRASVCGDLRPVDRLDVDDLTDGLVSVLACVL